ncbi:MAG: 1,4-dihydroxy-2-naphthoate octaprenyltransferase [Bacilli bacterium]|nr:1,4-dihydroxy-2-naphthoate octaprenyltransferase [Bacilli bacterium]
MQEGLETNQQPISNHEPAGGWKVWWRLLRPHTLSASFVPVLIGTALALLQMKRINQINMLLFVAMLAASILIQAATNMFNEYYDFKRGLDSSESVGIGGAIVREGIAAQTVLRLALVFFAVAMLLGVYICSHSSWWIALVGVICMAIGYLYTGGPYPIAYTPFGELMSGVVMGLIIILISFFIQSGMVTLQSVLISVPIVILIGAILMANNIRDLDGDQVNGRKTLAILLGRQRAIQFLTGMFAVSYLWVVYLVGSHETPYWLLLVFASVPKAVRASRGFQGKTSPLQMMPAMQATAQTNTQFGFLLALGLVLANWF